MPGSASPSTKPGCCATKAPRVLFPCSGAADTGEISDRVARQLARGGLGRMFCLAGVGGRVPFILDNMGAVGEIWAIDGCKEDCARHTLELAGFTVTRHLRVTDCGFEKGKAPATDDNVAMVLDQARAQAAE
jgi:uncharacterized metal-binding protein